MDPLTRVRDHFAESIATKQTSADALAERVAKEHFERGGGETAPNGEGPKRLRILR